MYNRFDSKHLENLGQAKLLRGHRISIREYNSGKNASYLLEAWNDPYSSKRVESVCKTIPGKGSDAKKAAIKNAFDLACTGLYKRKD